MGMSKVVDMGEGEIRILHQLNSDGSAYAEDVTVKVQPGVGASRLSYLASQHGKVGVFSYSFSPYDPAPEGLLFPDA